LKEDLTSIDRNPDAEETEDEESEENEEVVKVAREKKIRGEDDDSETNSEYPDEDVIRMQSQARSTFLSWLSTRNYVFHILGKAGSRKSTLIRLLIDYSQT
jgi:ABC-type molybdenum transport system ATPase subunit/photorepair protein PhrA